MYPTAISKYKSKYFKLKKQQIGGSICNTIHQTTHIFVHGACLDGGLTAYLLIKYCGVDMNKINYIAPGENIISELNQYLEANPEAKFGLYDLALPERDLDLNQLHIVNMIDHHISSARFKNKGTYTDKYATSGILWAMLNSDYQLANAPVYLKVVNKGDRGLLSINDSSIDEFCIYIGLQYILDKFAAIKKNKYEEVPNLMNYLINTNFLGGKNISLVKFIKFIGVYEIIKRYYEIYQYSDTCYTDKIGPNYEYTCIYIPKSRFVTTIAQIAGKTLQDVDFVIVYPDLPNTPSPRLTIRGISPRSDANQLAKQINPQDAGGHIKAASVGVTLDYIATIQSKLKMMKLQCLESTVHTNYLPSLNSTQREYFLKQFESMQQYIFDINKLINKDRDKENIPKGTNFKQHINQNFNSILDLKTPIDHFAKNFDADINSIIQQITNMPIVLTPPTESQVAPTESPQTSYMTAYPMPASYAIPQTYYIPQSYSVPRTYQTYPYNQNYPVQQSYTSYTPYTPYTPHTNNPPTYSM
jgi:hypothetical protein